MVGPTNEIAAREAISRKMADFQAKRDVLASQLKEMEDTIAALSRAYEVFEVAPAESATTPQTQVAQTGFPHGSVKAKTMPEIARAIVDSMPQIFSTPEAVNEVHRHLGSPVKFDRVYVSKLVARVAEERGYASLPRSGKAKVYKKK